MNPLLGLFIAFMHKQRRYKCPDTFDQLYDLYKTKIEEKSKLHQELNNQMLK